MMQIRCVAFLQEGGLPMDFKVKGKKKEDENCIGGGGGVRKL